MTLSFQRALGVEAQVGVQFSTDLTTWTGAGTRLSMSAGDAGRVLEVWRSANPAGNEQRQFGRLRLTQ